MCDTQEAIPHGVLRGERKRARALALEANWLCRSRFTWDSWPSIPRRYPKLKSYTKPFPCELGRMGFACNHLPLASSNDLKKHSINSALSSSIMKRNWWPRATSRVSVGDGYIYWLVLREKPYLCWEGFSGLCAKSIFGYGSRRHRLLSLMLYAWFN